MSKLNLGTLVKKKFSQKEIEDKEEKYKAQTKVKESNLFNNPEILIKQEDGSFLIRKLSEATYTEFDLWFKQVGIFCPKDIFFKIENFEDKIGFIDIIAFFSEYKIFCQEDCLEMKLLWEKIKGEETSYGS